MSLAICRSPEAAVPCCSICSDTGQHTKGLSARDIQCVHITAPHHPLVGHTFKVVRFTLRDGEPHVVIELPNGHHQLMAQRHTEAAAISSPPIAVPLRFTPGSLRALARMVDTLHHPRQPEVCNDALTTVPTLGDVYATDTAPSHPTLERVDSAATARSSVTPAPRKDR